jgi:hypothetical protein
MSSSFFLAQAQILDAQPNKVSCGAALQRRICSALGSATCTDVSIPVLRACRCFSILRPTLLRALDLCHQEFDVRLLR